MLVTSDGKEIVKGRINILETQKKLQVCHHAYMLHLILILMTVKII